MATSALERELAKVSVQAAREAKPATASALAGQEGAGATAALATVGKKPPPQLLAQKGNRKLASVIYDARQAEQISVETLLDRAENGLLDLIARNPRFRDYSERLFSRKALQVDR